MKTLRFVLGDQLTRGVAALADVEAADDVVLMVEVDAETRYVPHHPQKIALVLAAMRHFAAALRAEGLSVDYVALDDPAPENLAKAIEAAVARAEPGIGAIKPLAALAPIPLPGPRADPAEIAGLLREAAL